MLRKWWNGAYLMYGNNGAGIGVGGSSFLVPFYVCSVVRCIVYTVY